MNLTSKDERHAIAFRSMEFAVTNVRDAACVMEMAAEGTVFSAIDSIEHQVRAIAPWLSGYRLYICTNDQAVALEFTLRQVKNLTRELHDSYFAAFEGSKAP